MLRSLKCILSNLNYCADVETIKRKSIPSNVSQRATSKAEDVALISKTVSIFIRLLFPSNPLSSTHTIQI